MKLMKKSFVALMMIVVLILTGCEMILNDGGVDPDTGTVYVTVKGVSVTSTNTANSESVSKGMFSPDDKLAPPNRFKVVLKKEGDVVAELSTDGTVMSHQFNEVEVGKYTVEVTGFDHEGSRSMFGRCSEFTLEKGSTTVTIDMNDYSGVGDIYLPIDWTEVLASEPELLSDAESYVVTLTTENLSEGRALPYTTIVSVDEASDGRIEPKFSGVMPIEHGNVGVRIEKVVDGKRIQLFSNTIDTDAEVSGGHVSRFTESDTFPTEDGYLKLVPDTSISYDSDLKGHYGESSRLSVPLYPKNAMGTVTYSSSNESIATVGENGMVTFAEDSGEIEYPHVSIIMTSSKGHTAIYPFNRIYDRWDGSSYDSTDNFLSSDKGTEDEPYVVTVYNAEQFNEIMHELDDHGTLEVDLARDIDLCGHKWENVDYTSNASTDTLTINGYGHVVTGLNANNGLIRSMHNTRLPSATKVQIKNLTILDSFIHKTDSASPESAGAIVGEYYGCTKDDNWLTINSCAVRDTTIISEKGAAGGIVGRIVTNQSSSYDAKVNVYWSTVENCQIYGTENVGGVIGYIDSYYARVNTWHETVNGNTIGTYNGGSGNFGVICGKVTTSHPASSYPTIISIKDCNGKKNVDMNNSPITASCGVKGLTNSSHPNGYVYESSTNTFR